MRVPGEACGRPCSWGGSCRSGRACGWSAASPGCLCTQGGGTALSTPPASPRLPKGAKNHATDGSIRRVYGADSVHRGRELWRKMERRQEKQPEPKVRVYDQEKGSAPFAMFTWAALSPPALGGQPAPTLRETGPTTLTRALSLDAVLTPRGSQLKRIPKGPLHSQAGFQGWAMGRFS